MKKTVINTMILAGIAALSVSAANAATEQKSATVQWHAEAVKKSIVDFNVFTNNDSIKFIYDPTTKSFTTSNRELTIQAKGDTAATAYDVKAQLVQNKLTNGASDVALIVSANVGGINVTGTAPVDLLAFAASNRTVVAGGLESMELNKEGSLGPAGNKYHEGKVPVRFSILSATNAGTVIAEGVSSSTVTDGTYSGMVEMAFTASWTKP